MQKPINIIKVKKSAKRTQAPYIANDLEAMNEMLMKVLRESPQESKK